MYGINGIYNCAWLSISKCVGTIKHNAHNGIMLIRIMMKNDYIDHDCNTVDLFKKLKIITFNKEAKVIIFMNKN